MQWSQIKTLFILFFLVLDVFLFIQFLEKQDKKDLGTLERQDSTIEEQLETEGIEIGELPEEKLEESYINVGQKTFTEEELALLGKYDNQQVETINNNLIISRFDEPIPLPNDGKQEQIAKGIASFILSLNNYQFWGWNEELNIMVFFQQKNDRPVYFNQNGMILVFLNDANEMDFYTQTMLGEPESQGSKKSLISPLKAVETLYKNNEFRSGDEKITAEIGFHTMVPLENGIQVFAPTWKITVNNERNYFINAIDGVIFSNDDSQFLRDSLITIIGKVNLMSDENDMKAEVLEELTSKLEAINRSEMK